MAAQAILAEQVTVNSIDWTALAIVKGGVLTANFDPLDRSAMGTSWKRRLGGLGDGSLQVNLIDDVAAAGIDSILWALLNTIVTFEVRLSSAAVGTSNPKYTGSILVPAWGIGGQIGSLAEKPSLTFPVDGAITRATS